MLTLVSFLSGLVRRIPIVVIVFSLALTGVLGYYIQDQVLAEGNEGFAPEAPELDAFGEIGDLFGDDSSGQVLQVILTAPEGSSIISPEGRQVADQVTAAIEDAEIADRLQSTGGQPPIVSPFSAFDGGAEGPSLQVVVASEGGDILTPEGVALAGEVQAALAEGLADLLPTDGDQPPISSFAFPLALVQGSAPSAATISFSLAGPDVISAEGISTVLAFGEAVRGSQLGGLLIADTQMNPAIPSFLNPVVNAIRSGALPADALATPTVKQAYLDGVASLPAAFQGQVTGLLTSDVDLETPSATSGLIVFNFSEVLAGPALDGLNQIAASIALPQGFSLTQVPIEGGEEPAPLDTPDAVKEAYEAVASELPPEIGDFLPFLFSNDFDPDSLVATSGLVNATLTAEPDPDQLASLDEALAAIDVPDGYRVGHLPQDSDQGTFVQAFNDRLSFVPSGQADFFNQLFSSDADLEAGEAQYGLMVVFIDSAQDADDEVVLSEMQGALGEDLDALELPAGFSAGAFSFGLIVSEGSDVGAEVGRMFSIAGLIIIVILLFVYWVKPHGRLGFGSATRRTVADTLLTLLAIFMAIGWMQGLGVLMGPDYLGWIGYTNQIAQILPVLLIGLGVDYGIHMNSRFKEEAGGGNSVEDSIAHSIRTVGIALVLATMTTVVGFLTNLVSPVGALKDFGVLAAVGIVSAFFLLLTFVPAVRLLLDRRAERLGRWPGEDLYASKERLLPRLIGKSAWLAKHIPGVTVAVALALGGVGFYGVTQLDTQFSFVDFVPTDSPLLETYDVLTEEFGGGLGETTSVLIKGDLTTAATHNAGVDALENLADTPDVLTLGDDASVDGPYSLLVSLIDPASPTYSEAVATTAEEIGVGDDLRVPAGADVGALHDAIADADPSGWASVAHTGDEGVDAMLWTVSTQSGDDGVTELRANMNEDVDALRAAGLTAVVTSDGIIGDVVVESLQESQVSSLLVTIVISALILALNFLIESRRPFLGIITIAPVALVVLWTFGMMALTGIPFGPVTATISALAIGIGVPYTIHITHRFLEDRLEEDTTEDAVESTAIHTGGALAGSAFTTMAGFGSLVTSNLKPFQQFGAVTFYAIAFALLASVLVLPSMLVLWDRWHRRRGDATLDVAAVHRAMETPVDEETAVVAPVSDVGADPFA
jgi:predicted RND superfamily exporter protein